MQALLIKDLSIAADLDASAMSAVSGGTGYGYCMPAACTPSWPKWDYPMPGKSGNIDFNASQMLGQSQNTTVNNGNNVAFASGISASVNPSQHGANTINFG
ncbi:hypothetical protein [Noviherbaspirillum aridicola]|uniref:Uncharacterized protein n=1 Tax=Noviherbaspirillum aridicola TaxID=2849687 RepID=A0ABQ4Q8Z7_9BURK|nr:hypothetical protein [Noviherbaspirillum aridicola]GIZ53678.1 hypothetical protein NCCP691_36920 [Noviherbaspirillum aridicola]